MTEPQANITFLGGAAEIGASCALFEVGETRLLVDCGVRFRSQSALPNLATLQGKTLDAIVVTHAHTDHTGGLPVASDAWPNAPILATPPTIDITMILLRDALKIMSAEDREAEITLYAEKQVMRTEDRNAVLENGPCVIVASSGMLSGGASVHYAKQMAPHSKDAILITGYQDEESPGKALLDLAEENKDSREINIGGQTWPVKCRFEKYGFSAHADRMQMLGLIERLHP